MTSIKHIIINRSGHQLIQPIINDGFDHLEEMNDPTTPAIIAVGSPRTADMINCTAKAAISQHLLTFPLLLCLCLCLLSLVPLMLGMLLISNMDLLPADMPRPASPPNPKYISCQLSTNISMTQDT